MSVYLPDEIWMLIFENRAALYIQSHFRRLMFAHGHTTGWRTHILPHLVKKLNLEDLKLIYCSSWVRREWKKEPRSWHYMLEREAHQLWLIVAELRNDVANKVTVLARL